MALLTIGHSNLPIEAFLELLVLHGVTLVADVRSVPHSRRHQHFSRDELRAALAVRTIGYRHFSALGGKHAGSYARHMATLSFREALDQLLSELRAPGAPVVAAMCAEADPLRCHRQYLADAAVARGEDVIHLLSGGGFRYHALSPWARVSESGEVAYPDLLDGAGE